MEIKLKLAKAMYKEAAYAAVLAGMVTREFIRMAVANELERRREELCRLAKSTAKEPTHSSQSARRKRDGHRKEEEEQCHSATSR